MPQPLLHKAPKPPLPRSMTSKHTWKLNNFGSNLPPNRLSLTLSTRLSNPLCNNFPIRNAIGVTYRLIMNVLLLITRNQLLPHIPCHQPAPSVNKPFCSPHYLRMITICINLSILQNHQIPIPETPDYNTYHISLLDFSYPALHSFSTRFLSNWRHYHGKARPSCLHLQYQSKRYPILHP